MKLDVYVNYPGHCEEAFRFYERELGGRITGMRRHGEQPHPAPRGEIAEQGAALNVDRADLSANRR